MLDVLKNNQKEKNFTRLQDFDPQASLYDSVGNPVVKVQQASPGTSLLILGEGLVWVLQNLRTSWITTVMAFGGANVAQLYRTVEAKNPGKSADLMILLSTNKVSMSQKRKRVVGRERWSAC